jgi:hypothetical protein
MKATLFIGSILFTTSVYGYDDETQLMHDTAHVAGTYALTHVTEVACTKIVGKGHKATCTAVGAVLGNGVNIGRKAAQGFPADSKRAVLMGALGSGIAALVISIDW